MVHLVFDKKLAKQRRERIAKRFSNSSFLHENVASQLVERLSDTSRKFSKVLNLGSNIGEVSALLRKDQYLVTCVDVAESMLDYVDEPKLLIDDEILPFKDANFDLVISNLSLHKINDLPGVLAQINHSLVYNGLFLASMFAGQTLYELREVFIETYNQLNKPMANHIFPFTDTKTAGSLLQRVNFANPVADSETLKVVYPDIFTLMHDLQNMGESNFLIERNKNYLGKEFFKIANEIYKEKFAHEDGIIVSFEIVYLTGLGNAKSRN